LQDFTKGMDLLSSVTVLSQGNAVASRKFKEAAVTCKKSLCSNLLQLPYGG